VDREALCIAIIQLNHPFILWLVIILCSVSVQINSNNYNYQPNNGYCVHWLDSNLEVKK